MRTKLYDPKDYAKILPWWEKRSAPPIPKELLPSLGVIAEDDSGPAGAAWLYRDQDNRIAWLAWAVTNPANSALRSMRAIRILLGAAEELCREFGFPILVAETSSRGLIKTFERQGFHRNHESTQLWKGISNGT